MRGNRKESVGSTPIIRRALLRWYDRHRRNLPWRGTRDPYKIWISEIMLQQTRVAVIEPRYRDFLRRFPNVRALARAPLPKVLAAWSGLGYYRRARNLHAAAKKISCAKQFPRSSAELLELPGIGRYTAAAIASIAFNQPVAVVDGNVERVLARLFAIRAHRGANIYWQRAQELLAPARPGDFNQAMMELGAAICLPGKPLCADCPLENFCQARIAGSSFIRRRKIQRRRRNQRFLILRKKDFVYLVRRPENSGLMPGLWELPRATGGERNRKSFTARHSIMNTDYRVSAIISNTAPENPRGRWIKISSLPEIPLTGLARKLLRASFPALAHQLK
jgi:A/G-specific adenine glycosylase